MLLRLAWRNIWRNTRRTILTILAIFFATFLTVALRGIVVGVFEYNIKYTVELFSGYLQIQPTGYRANPSLNKSILYPGTIAVHLQHEPSLTGFAPRIIADGLISHKGTAAGTAIIGVDPEKERNVSRFRERIRSGTFIDSKRPYDIVVGIKLLENLKAQLGDTVVLLAQGFDGVMGNQKYRINGVVKFGLQEFDAATVLMDLGAAQELLAMEGRVNVIAVSVPALSGVGTARIAVTDTLAASHITGVRVLSWDEVIPELKEEMELKSVGNWFFFGILIFIAAFGILNTVLMSVLERFREFGISLAIGMRPDGLVKVVFIETLFISLIGIMLGSTLGYVTNISIAHHPIIISGEYGKLYEEYGFRPEIVATGSIGLVVSIAALVLVISCLVSIYPVYKTARLEPLKGIRYT